MAYQDWSAVGYGAMSTTHMPRHYDRSQPTVLSNGVWPPYQPTYLGSAPQKVLHSSFVDLEPQKVLNCNFAADLEPQKVLPTSYGSSMPQKVLTGKSTGIAATKVLRSKNAGLVPQKVLQSHCELMMGHQLSGNMSTEAEEEVGHKASADESSSSSSGVVANTKRRRRQRARPAERQAAAEKHRQGQHLAELVLAQKDAHMTKLEAGGEDSATAVAELRGAVWHLSLDGDGCEIVQLAIEKAQGAARASLCEELHGHVREAMGSPSANHVIQKVVESMPIDVAEFIAVEMLGIAVEACRHRYGCRIMCMLIEQFGASAACVAKVEKEIMAADVAGLIQHSFGRYVIQALLQHGSLSHKSIIVKELAKDLLGHATNRSGSYVIESAFMHCNAEDVAMLASKIVVEENLVPELVQHPFGIFVVRALLEMSGGFAAQVARDINSAPPAVQETEHYQRLLKLLKVDGDEDTAECPSSS